MKKTYKKLAIALLTVAVVAAVEAKKQKNNNDSGVYQPRTPWPFAPVEDAVVGAGATTAEIVTVGHADTGNAPSGLAVAVPDAVPGVSYARSKDSNDETSTSRKKSCKKNCRKNHQHLTGHHNDDNQ